MIFQLGPYLYALSLIIVLISLVRSKQKFTLSNFFIVVFFVYHGPAFFIYQYLIGYTAVYYKLSFALFLALLFYYIGRKILIFLKGMKPNYNDWFNGSIQPVYINLNTLIMISLLAVIIMLLALLVYGGLPFMLEGWTMDYRDLVSGKYFEMRKEGYLGDAGIVGSMFTYVISGIAPFISFVLIGYSLKYGRYRPFLFCYALIFAILLIISKLSTLHKAPGVFYVMQLIIFGYLLSAKKISIGKLIKTIGIALLVLIPIYLQFTKAESPLAALALIIIRVTMVPNYCLDDFFGVFPDVYPHTWGLNIRILHSLFGKGEYIPAHSLINIIGGKSNAVYIADAWVDFAWGGVIVYSLILGLVLTYIGYITVKEKNILSISMFAAFLGSVWAVNNTSLITCFITFGFLTIPILKNIVGWKLISDHSSLRKASTADMPLEPSDWRGS